MQLVAIGNNIINLDMVSVLDVDRGPAANTLIVRVLTNTNQSVIDITIPVDAFQGLLNLVPVQQRFRGQD